MALPCDSPSGPRSGCSGPQDRDQHAQGKDRGDDQQAVAEELIDYHTTDFATAATDVDVVLDAAGGDYPARSLRTLRPGGMLICLLPLAAEVAAEAARRGIRAQLMLVEADHTGMTAIADLVTQGKLRPVIAGTFPLADAAKAHALGDTGHTAGKLVLTMR